MFLTLIPWDRGTNCLPLVSHLNENTKKTYKGRDVISEANPEHVWHYTHNLLLQQNVVQTYHVRSTSSRIYQPIGNK